MNYLREEHRLPLSSETSSQDPFTALWEKVAQSHHFLKLTFSRSPTAAELEEALSHQDGSLSPYSTRLFREYEVIYEKKGTVLLTNRPAFPSLGTFFATEDSDAPHRYFVGFAFRTGPHKESITGLLLYVNEQGVCYADRTFLCRRILATYDTRNGLLRSDQTFLYHQTLLFAQIHRDTHKLMLHVAHLPYHTDRIQDHAYLYTSLELPKEALYRDTLRLFHRFLGFPASDHTVHFIDLGSLCIVEESHLYREGLSQIRRFLLLDFYTIYQTEDVPCFLEVAPLFPEKEDSDGYPLYCIRCHDPVLAATYSYKLHPMATMTCGLGSGYCPTCRIRYSLRRGSWVCAQIRLDGSLCHGKLLDIECLSSHLHASDQTLVSLSDPPQHKYPYRRVLRLQWLPSEEALCCARTTRILEENPDEEPLYRLRTDHDFVQEQPDEDEDDLFKEEPEVL